MEILRKGLKLIQVKGLECSEGSVNVPIVLDDEKDEYFAYTKQIHIRYLHDYKVHVEMLPKNDDGFYIPSLPLSENGPIELAVHMIRGERKFVTNELTFIVQKAPNGKTTVDPSQYDWQQLVDQYVEEKYSVIMARIDSLTDSSGNANLNELIDVRVGYDGTKYNTAGNSVRSQILELVKAQKSLKELIESNHNELSNRMDAFTTLGDGSTKADAEIVDARIDFEGNKKTNLGTSIREADKKLYDMIQSLSEMTMNNRFYTDLLVDLDTNLVDEDGTNVLADWRYKVE